MGSVQKLERFVSLKLGFVGGIFRFKMFEFQFWKMFEVIYFVKLFRNAWNWFLKMFGSLMAKKTRVLEI